MATTAQRFYYSTTEQDFTASGEVDIRKLLESAPGPTNTTRCTHPTAAGTTDITIDPYTNSTTQSDIRANCGWAINRAGSDGMVSTSTEKRIIPAGTWTFTMTAGIPAAGTATGTLTVSNIYNIYRVSSSGARTSLFTCTSDTVTSGLAASANEGVLTATFSASQITLEADETIHVGALSHMIQTAGLLGAVVSGIAIYTIGTTVQYVEVSSPGVRTLYLRTISETLSSANVTNTRIYNAIRTISETLTSANVTNTRVLVMSRSISETLASADVTNTRIYGAVRSISENVGSADVTNTRVFSANRTISETLTSANVTNTRVLTLNRTISETVGPSDVTNSRVANYNRSITEALATGGTTIIKKIFCISD